MTGLDDVLASSQESSSAKSYAARIVRSEKAAGPIAAISHGVEAPDTRIITAADIPGENILKGFGGSMPILADSEVRYVGQPIALIVGPRGQSETRESADVVIDYDRETPEFEFEMFAPHQVVRQREHGWGNPDHALTKAFQVVEGRYRTGIFEELTGLPTIASAVLEEDDQLTVYAATRWPHHVRSTIADVIGVSASKVRVVSTMAGVPVPRTLWQPSAIAAMAALAAVVTGRSVSIDLPPEDAFRFGPKPPMCVFRHTTGLDEDGDPLVVDAEAIVNVGAYPISSDEVVDRVLATALGGYRAPHVRVRVIAVTTNIPPVDLADGIGSAQALFAAEMHASRIVEVAQLDPLAFRKRNILGPGTRILGGSGNRGESSAEGTVAGVQKQSDFARKHAAFELQKKRRESFISSLDTTRGIGISVVGVGTGLTGLRESSVKATASVRLEKEGSATLLVSAVPESLSMRESWRATLAETLDVDPESVTIQAPDTEGSPDSGPSLFSRNIAFVTRVIENCCAAIQKKRFRSPLPIEVKRSFRLPKTVGWDSDQTTGDPFASITWGSCVVEVQADPTTLVTQVRDVWIAVDAGTRANDRQAREAIELGVMRSLFWAGSSSVEYRKGRIGPADYSAAPTADFSVSPHISVTFIDAGARAPLRGIGELALCSVPAAYIQAVSQATGQYLDKLPSTPRTIFGYLEEE